MEKHLSAAISADIDLPLADGIFSREGLIQLIQKNLDLTKISSSSRQVFANTSQRNEDGSYLARYFQLSHQPPERIPQILLASSAMPVAYPSVLLDGQPNLDGGITDNLPIVPLYDMGLRHIVAINNAEEEDLLIPAVYPGTEFIEDPAQSGYRPSVGRYVGLFRSGCTIPYGTGLS